ncbi:MAG: metal ABC transporter substrate-binding protein [Limnochordia bacterium]|jgi:ABC-type Zn uptake system ZnuABC Zn-binding protein ZnuA
MSRYRLWVVLVICLSLLALFALARQKRAVNDTDRLQVVVTSNIVGDLVQQVGGDHVEVYPLLRPGVDPHTYHPVPADLQRIAAAQLVVLHGLGLDSWADRLIESSGTKAQVITVTEGITPLMDGDHPDPHCWLDPNLVMIYVSNIGTALKSVDASRARIYSDNASRFATELEELDAWVRTRISSLPEGRRKLVTNHDSFAYFAHRYGFEVIGTVMPSLNPEAEPSARHLTSVVETVRREGVRAIFTEDTLPQTLAETIASQTDHPVRIIRLYTGSLSEAGGKADTYLKFIRSNVQAIVDGLL